MISKGDARYNIYVMGVLFYLTEYFWFNINIYKQNF